MTTNNAMFFIFIMILGELIAFFLFKLLRFLLNKDKGLKIDRAVLKGILERFFLFLCLVYGFPQGLIAFGALKIGTRFIPEENKISNDYFYIGNILSLLIAVTYYAIWSHFINFDLF
jgi:hypothetical protein